MKWNQDIFIRNIKKLIVRHFDGTQDRLNDIVGRDSVSRWKRGDRPALTKLLEVTEVFHCTLDDLLLENKSKVECFVNCDEEMTEICRKIKELRDSRSHWWDSLDANIKSFKKGLDNDKKLTAVEQRVQILEKVTSSGSSSGTQKPAVRTGRKRKAG